MPTLGMHLAGGICSTDWVCDSPVSHNACLDTRTLLGCQPQNGFKDNLDNLSAKKDGGLRKLATHHPLPGTEECRLWTPSILAVVRSPYFGIKKAWEFPKRGVALSRRDYGLQ